MNVIFNSPSAYIYLLIPAAIAVMILKPRERFFTLRLLIYFLLFFVLLSPYIKLAERDKTIPEIAIYIDNSLSMGISDRINNAMRTAEDIFSILKSRANLKFYKFSNQIKEVDRENLKNIIPDGDSTDMVNIIRDTGHHGKIIISDGRYNKGFNPLAVNEINSVPIYTTGPGGGSRAVDLAITELKAPEFGFRNEKIEIDFKVLVKGRLPGESRVDLKENNNLIASRKIEPGGQSGGQPAEKKEIPVKFSFIPTRAELKNYTLEIKALSEEINKANNRRNFRIHINRRKIRILYVSGRPSWEYSLLRRLLKSDWQIDLVTFLILRNPDNIAIVPENQLSLIHFPAREMFTEKIYDFDLLIYENFSYKRFFPKSYLEHIKKFVNGGGAFLMIGGKESFAGGGYIDTPIEDILPVKMTKFSSESSSESPPEKESKRQAGWENESFKVQIKKDIRHPVLDIAGDPKISQKIWDEMPELFGYDKSLEAKPGTAVILAGPKSDGTGRVPILTLAESGRGRTAALNTQSTWRWCMGLAGEGKTPYYYNQFWYKLIRYLIQSAELKKIQVFPETLNVNAGQTAKINIKAVDRYWEPVKDAKLDAEVLFSSEKISSENTSSDNKSSVRVPSGPVTYTGEGGWYSVSVPVNEVGAYKVTVNGSYRGQDLGRGKAEFSGVRLNKEYMDTTLNRDLLEKIARQSG
ncbi:MAG: hypothetical protein PF545_03550 [Elusimicrobia bacterium]|jgi:uncharacterized membrane protein|nr:hypothetical protein [Elusimicrobiota bacterium]